MRATPSAKNLASQHRLDLGKIEGTGTRGLITVGDVLERINFQPGMEQSKGPKGDVPTPGDERRDFFGVRRGPMKIPTDRSEPGGWGLAGGSITLLGIIGAIVLITAVFSLSLGWTIGLNIGLVIVGLVFAGATIEGLAGQAPVPRHSSGGTWKNLSTNARTT